VQNLRHFEYNPGDRACAASLSQEIASAINKSEFLARRTYQKILQTVSPSAVQFMHQEANRAFPVISFKDGRMPIMNTRIHAATELLGCGALKNRTVLRQGGGKGPAVVYEWSELGLKMMSSLLAITPERRAEMAAQIASVAEGDVPPQRLLDLPQPEPGPQGTDAGIDMVKAAEVDTTDPATST
jgi:hypothetical protein